MAACAIDGCERRKETSHGWCLLHYKRWKRTGDPEAILRVSRAAVGCSVDGCDEPHCARGWCHRHYYAWHRNGDPVTVLSTHPEPRRACAVDGCPDPLNGGGYCNKHGKRVQRWGDPHALGYGQVDADTPTVVYLIEHPQSGALKVGLGVQSRLEKWERRGWQFIASRVASRRDSAQLIERAVLTAWDGMGFVRPFLSREAVQDGYTETVPATATAIAVARRIMEES